MIGAVLLSCAAVEGGLHLLVRRLRRDFPWLVVPADAAPEIPEAVALRHGTRSFDADLGWCRVPGEHAIEHTGNGDTSFTVDPHGRRLNPGFGGRPAEVAAFGDSFTFCRLVDDDETWPHHLSAALDENVANYGVGNYGLDQALLRLESEIDALDARVVVMGVVPETIARVQSYWKHYFEYGNTLAFKPRFTLGANGLVLHQSAVRRPEDYLTYRRRLPEIQRLDGFYRSKFLRDVLTFPYLPRILARWRRHVPIMWHLLRGNRKKAFQVVLRDNARWTARLYRDPGSKALLRALIDRFAETCRSRGKEPVLLVMPQPTDEDTAYREVFASAALPVVDVTDVLRRDDESLWAAGKLGPHPSGEGNELIARALAPVVEELLDRAGSGTSRSHRRPPRPRR